MVFSSTSTRVWYTKNCNNWEAESNSFFHPEQNSSNKIFFTNSSVIIPLKNVSISEKAVSWWYFSFKTFLCTFKCTDEHTQTLWCKDCGTQKTVLLFVITFDHIDSTKGPPSSVKNVMLRGGKHSTSRENGFKSLQNPYRHSTMFILQSCGKESIHRTLCSVYKKHS